MQTARIFDLQAQALATLSKNAKYENKQSQSSEKKQEIKSSSSTKLLEAYQILGCRENLPFNEIKSKFRKLSLESHPDRAIAEGLPPELVILANEN